MQTATVRIGILLGATLLYSAACATRGGEQGGAVGKRAAARYFFRWELPRTAPQLDLLDSLDRTTLDMADPWF